MQHLGLAPTNVTHHHMGLKQKFCSCDFFGVWIFGLLHRPTSPIGALALTPAASGQPLRPEGLAKELLPTPTPRLRPGNAEALLTALLRLAQPEPTGTNRPRTPARKGPGNERRKQDKALKSNYDTRDRTLYTCRYSTLQPP